MNQKPTVSVVIALYNKGDYIERTVNSALSQTFLDFEIVVVDDGSTDGGAEKLRNLHDPRIILIKQDNAGAAAARNRGMREARGKLIAFLDADDIWLPDHLLHLMKASEQFPLAALIGNAFIESASIDIPDHAESPVHYYLIKDYFGEGACGRVPFFTSSCMVSRIWALQLGGFPVGNYCGEDLALWMKLAAAEPVVCTTYVGAWYRRAANSLS
jgi:glycosyltransferase involved in cell wall biosynthesis